MISLQHNWKVTRNPDFQTSVDMIYKRKLLGYERNFFVTRPTRHSRIRRQVTLMGTLSLMKRKRNVNAKGMDSNDEDIGNKIIQKTTL